MSSFLRGEDPNHLISLGAEGHFALGSGSEFAGPYGSTGSGSLLPMSNCECITGLGHWWGGARVKGPWFGGVFW
jgi:hypothetical protein